MTELDKRETDAWNDQQADAMPGPDPTTICNECEGEYRVSQFKEYGKISNDPNERVLCGECIGRNIERRSVYERREENHELIDF